MAVSAEPRAARRAQVAALALVAVVGLLLRLWNASTARTHDDEMHYAEDAMWGLSPLSAGAALSFLRHHPRDHLRLDPGTGALRPWGRPAAGEIARLGHPCVLQYAAGLVTAAVAPASVRQAVLVGRQLNAVLDTTTILLLPDLAVALGAAPATGLLSAALYALYPPAVSYGSLDYLDPPLAPLLVLLLLGILNVSRTGTGWLSLGAVTGLFLGTKQVGMIALVLVPVAIGLLGPRSVRGLASWAVATLVTVTLFTDPVAYFEGLLHPSRPIGQLRLDPVTYVAGNVAFMAQPSAYYWLSFSRHGEPLAPLMSRVHPVLTPAYLVAYALGLATAVAGRAGRRLLILYLPALPLLAFILPSDGLWRFHLLAPLVCLGAACALTAPSGAAVLAAAGLAGMTAFLPAHPAADGQLGLGDLLRMNPQARQRQGFYDAAHPLAVQLAPGVALDRLVWLSPGRYEVSVQASTAPAVGLEGRPVPAGGSTSAEVELHGFFHRLTVALPLGGDLEAVSIRPVG